MLVDTVPTECGRFRGDAGACPVDKTVTCRPAVNEPGNESLLGGRWVTTGAPPWGSNLNADATVALPSGRKPVGYKKAEDPEMDEVTVADTFADLGRRRKMSGDQWNKTQRLTYNVSSLPWHESRSRRQMTAGYGTGYRNCSSSDERSRHWHESEALAIAMRLEAWADNLRRHARYRDDRLRHRNRGDSKDDSDTATYHRQLTQRLDVVDRQLAELWYRIADVRGKIGWSQGESTTGCADRTCRTVEHQL